MSFKSKKQAEAKRDEVLAVLGDGWEGEVWNNLGWHCAWQLGSVTLYYSVYGDNYHTLVGDVGGCGGHMDLSVDLPSSKDPLEAVRMACDGALEVMEQKWKPIQESVTSVREAVG